MGDDFGATGGQVYRIKAADDEYRDVFQIRGILHQLIKFAAVCMAPHDVLGK